jgi:hypothetical protein
MRHRKFTEKFRNHKATASNKKKVSKNQMQCTRPTSSLLSLASLRARLAFRALGQKIVQDAALATSMVLVGDATIPLKATQPNPWLFTFRVGRCVR